MRIYDGPPKKTLLFIDTGDNCRCPMAAGYLLKLLEQRGIRYIDMKTAGVMTPTGLLPTPESVQLLQEEGVDIRRHRSRPLSPELIRKADLILGMTPFHVQTAFRMAEEARGKTFLLKEYVGREGRNTQIADPMGGTMEIFKKCFAEIRASLQRLVEMEFITQPPQAPEEAPREVPAPEAAPAEAEPKAAQEPKRRGRKPKAEQAPAPAPAKKAAKAPKAAGKAKETKAPKAAKEPKASAKAAPKPAKKAATPSKKKGK